MTKSNESEDLCCKIRECAEECGLTEDDCNRMLAAGDTSALTNGELFQKFLDFLSKIAPFIIPVIFGGNSTDATDESGKGGRCTKGKKGK